MKNFILMAVAILVIVGAYVWLTTPTPAPLNANFVRTVKPVADVTLDKNVVPKGQGKLSTPDLKTNSIIGTKTASAKVKVNPKASQQAEALTITAALFVNIYNNESIDFSSEKALLNYLKETNDEQIYQFIIEKLQAATIGNKSDDRVIEYSLGLLAAIDSSRASEIFYNFVANDNWQGSSAIYAVRKSIEKLNRNGHYTDVVQQTFTQASDNSPFIGELAESIALHAQTEQLDYLIGYVDGNSKNKSTVASKAMKKIYTESLVPHIVSYLSDNSTKKVQDSALNTLANMGQYEAASALITWSAIQPKESAAKVEELFNLALRRSPSTKRAIEKEIQFQTFVSEELKNIIINLSKKELSKG